MGGVVVADESPASTLAVQHPLRDAGVVVVHGRQEGERDRAECHIGGTDDAAVAGDDDGLVGMPAGEIVQRGAGAAHELGDALTTGRKRAEHVVLPHAGGEVPLVGLIPGEAVGFSRMLLAQIARGLYGQVAQAGRDDLGSLDGAGEHTGVQRGRIGKLAGAHQSGAETFGLLPSVRREAGAALVASDDPVERCLGLAVAYQYQPHGLTLPGTRELPRAAGSVTGVAHPSEPSFLVLHGLRLKGFADTEAIASTSGLTPEELDKVLPALQDDELVLHREGRITGWALTPAGRGRHAELLSEELEASNARDKVDAAYRRFLEINSELLAVCTAWQLRSDGGEPTPNDHTDAEYDNKVIDRLAAVDEAVAPICDDLASVLGRFERYHDRLSSAVAKVQAGQVEWFTKPMIDSYHTVWFELHEDLLVTLGIERHREGEA